MEYISEYTKTIAYYMIFAALVGIIAPSGNFKKYIQLVLSLTLIAIIIEPVAAFLHDTDFIETNSFFVENSVERQKLKNAVLEQEEQNYERVIEEYRKNLIIKTAQTVKEKTGFELTEIDVKVNEDYGAEAFGEVLEISATALVDLPDEEENAVKKFAFGNATATEDKEKTEKKIIENIKKCLTDFYSISESNIHIKVQDF